MNYTTLDFLLSCKNICVEFRTGDGYAPGGEYVWVETVNGSELIVHGEIPGYTREDAYEDALRECMGIVPIADEARL